MCFGLKRTGNTHTLNRMYENCIRNELCYKSALWETTCQWDTVQVKETKRETEVNFLGRFEVRATSTFLMLQSSHNVVNVSQMKCTLDVDTLDVSQ